MNNIAKHIFISSAFIFSAFSASAEEIIIKGNKRIEAATIKTYMELDESSPISESSLSAALRRLHSSGFFADIKISRTDNAIVVEVEESPIIGQIAFEGNERIEDTELLKETQMKERDIFTRAKLQNDIERIKQLYQRSGRFNVEVEPKAIQREQNRIDIVYEITENELSLINNINFIGNSVFDNSTLREVLRTQETAWYKILTSDDTYDPDRIEFDKELLKRFYTDSGFADFKVEGVIVEATKDGKGFDVTFSITEGQRFDFGEINVASELQKVPTDKLESALTTVKGELFNASQIENSVDKVIGELGNLGFAFVDVQPKTDIDRENRLVNISYQISEGPRVYVERIDITGNVRTLDEVVRREMRVGEGDAYNKALLERSEQRINNLGYFGKVKFENIQGSAPDKVVVNVDVEEQSTGQLTFGVGFSTADGVLGDVSLKENNLLGTGQKVELALTAAQERQQIQFGYTKPYFLDRDIAAGVDIYTTKTDFKRESSFQRDSVGGKLRANYPLTENLRHGVYYSFDITNITDVDSDASIFIKRQEGERTTSAVGHSLTYDKRDNIFEPNSGYVVRLNQEIAGLGGTADYFRNEVRAQNFYTLTDEVILQFAANGGIVTALDSDVAINDRFFIGSTQIRGFDKSGIGPRDRGTLDSLGGNMFYSGTTELTFPIGLPNELGIKGAVFLDAASLWDVDDVGNIEDDDSTRLSSGVGLAWKSPFGPLRVDFGKAFVKNDYDRTETFRLSFGSRF